ncbi:hypothetical protein DIU31_015860 [Mucilaginibacter rubeus]|uniref:UbiA family prenyltransferase n=1 Tax=Mucilaginibacter rubeus TaxID=2027860 RepID=A0AAE6JG36_9SPHI|nr:MULTISPECIES: UbiA family prenyltransferase [Mucilaginibacter]QEM04915.1 hypothetical protein DIU31_015860 [Mucilaginibacter rubeus]QEM17509.1 hypothetical protein DIU38_016025 [Mucilaginibacter gossypii]QTE45970.1 UbiA family prenyltransferase [Mucilaginibacter rubeus]QTE52567.1 UbiA family prenyltransferase [Mucilaginibacter rubeus]QTE57656.1 UbiA family prenyltransferase [Mucilaginibacter rubeus]
MNKYIKQILDFFIYTHIFIASCAVAQGLVTYYLLRVQVDKNILAILFCATIAVYNFGVLLSNPAKAQNSTFPRVNWIFNHIGLIKCLTSLAVVSLTLLVIFISSTSRMFLLFLAIPSIAYNLPLLKINGKWMNLRNVPGLKLLLIALVWSASCVILPIVELQVRQTITISAGYTLILFANRFLFFAAIAIPFDIRDKFQDKKYGLKTIPVLFGEKKAYRFCLFLLAGYLLLLFALSQHFDLNFFALLIAIIFTWWLIFRFNRNFNDYYYFLYLDGTMILQFVMLLLVVSI